MLPRSSPVGHRARPQGTTPDPQSGVCSLCHSHVQCGGEVLDRVVHCHINTLL